MSFLTPVRVVGVGSPNGDDAVAWRIVEKLRTTLMECDGIECHVADGGQRLLDLIDGSGSLVIVDAAEGVGPPGKMLRFIWPDDQLAALRPGTTHDLGIDAALRLAKAVGTLPSHVVVYAVAAESFDPGSHMNPKLSAAVPELANRVFADLGLVGAQASEPCTKPHS